MELSEIRPLKETLILEIKGYESAGNLLDEFMFAFVDDYSYGDFIRKSGLKEPDLNHIDALGHLHPEYDLYTEIRADYLISLDLAEECINWVNGYE